MKNPQKYVTTCVQFVHLVTKNDCVSVSHSLSLCPVVCFVWFEKHCVFGPNQSTNAFFIIENVRPETQHRIKLFHYENMRRSTKIKFCAHKEIEFKNATENDLFFANLSMLCTIFRHFLREDRNKLNEEKLFCCASENWVITRVIITEDKRNFMPI